jgi:hypothetical protein
MMTSVTKPKAPTECARQATGGLGRLVRDRARRRRGVRVTAGLAGPGVVAICERCRSAWEPNAREECGGRLRTLSAGCPSCGDWLYLAELVEPIVPTLPRKAG